MKPIAFKKSEQKVIGEIIVNENKKTSMLVPSANGYGINFNQSEVQEKSSKVYRVEIEVNEFIKNFEKVL
jgi:hypothetical protein